VAAPDWLSARLRHTQRASRAVGGPVAPQNLDRCGTGWCIFCEYNNQMPPWQDGETASLGSANICYKPRGRWAL